MELTEEIIQLLASHSVFAKHLHIPLQSGSDRILKDMKRSYRSSKYLGILDKVRELIPDSAISTDIIVGFPSETEEDFQRTVDFVEEYHDCMAEILTCSAFLIHNPLLVRWRDEEKQWIEYINGVNFTTKWNTPLDRLDRLEKIEVSFKKIGIPYSIYNRGLYQELHEEQMKEKAAVELAQRQLEVNKQQKKLI